MTPWAEALLYAAPRAQHVDEVIRPALERGASVICDRYVDSSVAYQGVGRGLGLDRVLDLNLAAVGGLLPDRTFLLELDVAEIGGRLRRRPRSARARVRRLPRPRRGGLPRARRPLPGADRRPRRHATRPTTLAEEVYGALRARA